MFRKTLADKPHVICIPCPAQSHVKAMLKLAKLLHSRGFLITFVNTEFNHRRMLKSRGPFSLNGLPDFRFKSIPDGLPPSDENAINDIALPFIKKLIYEFNFIFFVADESFLSNGYLDKVVDWIPGMRDIRLRDLPSFVRTTDPNDLLFKYCLECTGRASEGSAVIFHTFDVLEQEVLNALYSMFPRVYTIGPLQLLLNQIQEVYLSSIGCNIWKEEVECLQWLDSNKPKSVIYVNFGSITTVTKEQLVEFGMGLAKSGHPFLWIIRPDMVTGDSKILPPEFTQETKERSFICSWCPQEEVLNHPSVGGFLTHSGWGSTIESISSGVPMLCWPFFADQQTNCRYTCSEWGIGMEIDNNVKRDKVVKLVRELMEGEKGKSMKKKAMEWKKLAEEANGPSGSSSMNLDKLVKEVLLS
nr:7-deoxyloganetin glucosyltransferase-like [Populus alba]